MWVFRNGERFLIPVFNTSGEDYRKLNLKDKLAKLSTDEAIEFLSRNGNLVKRPFVPFDGSGLVGFKQDEWEAAFTRRRQS